MRQRRVQNNNNTRQHNNNTRRRQQQHDSTPLGQQALRFTSVAFLVAFSVIPAVDDGR